MQGAPNTVTVVSTAQGAQVTVTRVVTQQSVVTSTVQLPGGTVYNTVTKTEVSAGPTVRFHPYVSRPLATLPYTAHPLSVQSNPL
jgi:hypothetical protein